MILHTPNSSYEIDVEGNRARRLNTNLDANAHHLSDGEWHEYEELLVGLTMGDRVVLVGDRLPKAGDGAVVFIFRDGTYTQTSPICEVEGLEDAA